jgi:hypothetical protein
VGRGLKDVIRKVAGLKEPEPPKLPPKMLETARRVAGYCGVYIVAPKASRWPIKFGVSQDSANPATAFQSQHWEEGLVHAFWLTPGRPAAERIKKRMMENLRDKQHFFNPNFYNCTVEEAEAEMKWAAECEGIELFDELEAERRYYVAVTRAIEQKAGIQRELVSGLSPPSNIVPLRPRGK